jgi:hypothetical protein
MQLHLAHARELADVERVGGEQRAGTAALDGALAEGRVGLLDGAALFRRELEALLGRLVFELEEPLEPRA